MPRLRCVLHAVILLHGLHLALCETAFVHDVRGSPAFEKELKKYPLIFAKFFHPGCPHCQAMKQSYDDLAALFGAQNSSLRFVEIDGSQSINTALIETHAKGFPSLKLFIRAKLAAEYDGARETDLMAVFLKGQLALENAPLISRIRNKRDLDTFLETHANRSVILAGGDMVRDPALDKEFRVAAALLRAASIPSVAFATVDFSKYLVPTEAYKRYERFAVFGSMPYAVAARSGAKFKIDPQWWFPGVMGGDSLQTFMHVATLPIDGMAALTTANALAVSASMRPILYAFGSRSTPNLALRDELRELALYGAEDLVVVYAHDLDFLALRDHLGLNAINDEQKKMPRQTEFVLYRAGNKAATRMVFSEKQFASKKLWLKHYFDTHEKAPERFGKPYVLNNLTKKNWDALLNHDGRSVLLSFCQPGFGTCDRFQKTLEKAASSLGRSASKITVAFYDTRQGPIPKSATFKTWETLPYLAVVLPGEKPKQIEPVFHASVIEKQVLEIVNSKSKPAISVHEDPRFVVTLSHIGILFIAVGVAISTQRKIFHSRYATIARIRNVSAKSV